MPGELSQIREQRVIRSLVEAWTPEFQQCRKQYDAKIVNIINLAKVCDAQRERLIADLIKDLRKNEPSRADELLSAGLDDLIPCNRIDFSELARVLQVRQDVEPPVSYEEETRSAAGGGGPWMESENCITEETTTMAASTSADSPARATSEASLDTATIPARIVIQQSGGKRTPNCDPRAQPIDNPGEGGSPAKRRRANYDLTQQGSADEDDPTTDHDMVVSDLIRDHLGAEGEPEADHIGQGSNRASLHSEDVEGRDYIFDYSEFGPGFFVLRCERHVPGKWKNDPLGSGAAINHFRRSEKCPTHKADKNYTAMDIMQGFSYQVNGIDRDFVKRSNERYLQDLKISSERKSKIGRRLTKGGASKGEGQVVVGDQVIVQTAAGVGSAAPVADMGE